MYLRYISPKAPSAVWGPVQTIPLNLRKRWDAFSRSYNWISLESLDL